MDPLNLKRVKDKFGNDQILFDGVLYSPKLFFGNNVSNNLFNKLVKKVIPKSLHHSLINFINPLRKLFRYLKTSNRKNKYIHLKNENNMLKKEIEISSSIYQEDIYTLLRNKKKFPTSSNVDVISNFPVAYESNDHIHPEGTRVDNTRSKRFVIATEKLINKPLISIIDFGCAGGGLVFDFLLRGHNAIGLDGSDYSLKSQRAHWKVIPNHLFTCDITKPFRVKENGNDKKFDLITAWEFFEHIPEQYIKNVFDNISKLIDKNGYFIGSIGTSVSFSSTGHPLHMTVETKHWWQNIFLKNGYKFLEDHTLEFEDFCRGTGNSAQDPDFRKSNIGFHFVSRKLI